MNKSTFHSLQSELKKGGSNRIDISVFFNIYKSLSPCSFEYEPWKNKFVCTDQRVDTNT